MILVDTKLRLDVDGALANLAASVGEGALRAAGFAGAEVFRAQVLANAPEDSGLLKSEVIIARATDKSDGANVQTYVVRVRAGKKQYANTKANRRSGRVSADGKSAKTYGTTNAFYWKFLEYGTSRMAKRPFIRPAYEEKKQSAMDAMRSKLSQKIQQALGST